MEIFQTYPDLLRTREAEAIRQRRNIPGITPPTAASSTDASCDAAPTSAADSQASAASGLPPDTVGLALSGGGIRSATFCLGALQTLAKLGFLRRIDLLSTVSGGGYIGSFLGRFYDRLRGSPVPPPDLVEDALRRPQSDEIQWLRRHGNYIAPDGRRDAHIDLATFLRNFLTVHLVVGLLVFALFGLANFIRYGVLETGAALLPYLGAFSWHDMPFGRLILSGLGAFWSPWFILIELVLLVHVIPHIISYWLSSPQEPERFHGPVLFLDLLLAGTFLWLGVRDGFELAFVLAAVPFLAAFGVLEWAWKRVRQMSAAVGSGGASVERLRTRNYLTRDLAVWLVFLGGFILFALIDTVGQAIYEAYDRDNESYLSAFARLGAGLAVLLPVLRFLATFLSHRESRRRKPNVLIRWLTRPALSGVFAIVLMVPPLILISYAAHAAYEGGTEVPLGISITLGALFISAVIAHPKSITFINRSSLSQTYAARLSRAYLGASNPLRHGTLGQSIDEVMPEDDCDSPTNYRPFEAGGPLHIVNVCVNQTLDPISQRLARDRQGTIMAVSSLGLSIGTDWHALWNGQKSIIPAGYVRGTTHPLLDVLDDPPKKIEVLPLRQWMAISGAAFGPGLGQLTNRALSFLFTLANLRTGYWWDSGLSAADRGVRPQVSFIRRLLYVLPNLFLTQARLLDETLARFPGPWWRFWYLTDGGHFENLGIYELIRRRVPFMISIDAGADAEYVFKDFANLQRKARIDFDAHIEPFTAADWSAAQDAYLSRKVPKSSDPSKTAEARDAWTSYFEPIRAALGLPGADGDPFFELRSTADSDGRVIRHSGKHAALFRIRYPDNSTPSLLLYLKASLTGDEPGDVSQYHSLHPEFPHQSTADQFFDEEQWESYRCLGEHVSRTALAPGTTSDPDLGQSLWLHHLRY